jgi:putative glutamine amidotransferase
MLIGLVSSPTATNKFGLNAAYVEYFRTFGNIVILDPTSDQVMDLDLLVLPGGADVNPLRYNAKPSAFTQSPNISYEYFDEVMLPKYIDNNTPIVGICRGFQSLGVLFGCTLTQDFPFVYSAKDRSDRVEGLQFNIPEFTPGGYHSKSLNPKKQYQINSIHHQGFFPNQINDDAFDIIATSTKHGNVEAMIHKHLPIAGVQYHPEELYIEHTNSTPLFNEIVKSVLAKSTNEIAL